MASFVWNAIIPNILISIQNNVKAVLKIKSMTLVRKLVSYAPLTLHILMEKDVPNALKIRFGISLLSNVLNAQEDALLGIKILANALDLLSGTIKIVLNALFLITSISSTKNAQNVPKGKPMIWRIRNALTAQL
jgi:hypothetical protein